MAGSYPDVPGYRFAYDVDGTAVVLYELGGGAITPYNSAQLSSVNKEVNNYSVTSSIGSSHGFCSVIFPEIRSISGYFISVYSTDPAGGRILETSADTTNGQDGSWTVVESSYINLAGNTMPSTPGYRQSINPANWTNVKAIRFRYYANIYVLHFYGAVPYTESPDRLRVVDMSDLDIAAQLDFGNIPQRNTSTKQFKVVNNSSTKTASSITVSLNTTSDASPNLIGQFQISNDNVAFANAINIGTLAPGASSGTLYIRNAVANNAQLGPWAVRIIAHPTSWS